MAENFLGMWVRPYDNNDNPINTGAGYFSDTTGYPLNWKVEQSNNGRLIRKVKYKFQTNNNPFAGPIGSKDGIVRYATVLQHGLEIFDYSVDGLMGGVKIINLTDVNSDDDLWGYIETTGGTLTNALCLITSIKVSDDTTYKLDEYNILSKVEWASDENLVRDYLNKVRASSSYDFNILHLNYGSSDSYQGDDDHGSHYRFKMVYRDKSATTCIAACELQDISEYFNQGETVTEINVKNLNSGSLTFLGADNTTITYKEYYKDLLEKGEENTFNYKLTLCLNPIYSGSLNMFDAFTDLTNNSYFISNSEMLPLEFTIKPHGIKQKIDSPESSWLDWNYSKTTIKIYIVNCQTNPYLYLKSDTNSNDYNTELLSAGGNINDSMPVFSNMGWDISVEENTSYVGYNNNNNNNQQASQQ